jgi:hypothetical protein
MLSAMNSTGEVRHSRTRTVPILTSRHFLILQVRGSDWLCLLIADGVRRTTGLYCHSGDTGAWCLSLSLAGGLDQPGKRALSTDGKRHCTAQAARRSTRKIQIMASSLLALIDDNATIWTMWRGAKSPPRDRRRAGGVDWRWCTAGLRRRRPRNASCQWCGRCAKELLLSEPYWCLPLVIRPLRPWLTITAVGGTALRDFESLANHSSYTAPLKINAPHRWVTGPV